MAKKSQTILKTKARKTKAKPPAILQVKPPYIVPSLSEIMHIPWNGRTAFSTFSGCGGSSLGYRWAGYRVLASLEFIPAAIATYQANFPNTPVIGKDVRKVTPEEVLELLGLQQGDLDIYDGSPPCAAFSTSGKRSEGWNVPKSYSDTVQRVDDLFFEYIRLLKGLMPKVFVAENVSGLVKGVAKGYFLEILETMKAAGYRVTAKKLDARWLGVPQQRERLIFVGVRSDLGLDPVFPRPYPQQYTVKDVLPHIAYVKHSGHAYNYKPSWEAPSPTIMQSEYGRPESAYLSGGGWVKTESGDTRQWNLEELRLLCSFPADFQLIGTPAQQWERLGRAVPPLMMKAVADAIYDGIFKRLAS